MIKKIVMSLSIFAVATTASAANLEGINGTYSKDAYRAFYPVTGTIPNQDPGFDIKVEGNLVTVKDNKNRIDYKFDTSVRTEQAFPVGYLQMLRSKQSLIGFSHLVRSVSISDVAVLNSKKASAKLNYALELKNSLLSTKKLAISVQMGFTAELAADCKLWKEQPESATCIKVRKTGARLTHFKIDGISDDVNGSIGLALDLVLRAIGGGLEIARDIYKVSK